MNFIHCADLHLCIKKYGISDPKTGLNSRVLDDLKQFDKIIDYAINKKIDLFLIAGDVFDKRTPDEIVQREFAKRLRILIDNKITTVVLTGNHEGVTSTDMAHCLSSIDIINDSEYLFIVDKPKMVLIKKLKVSILCLPYNKTNVFENIKSNVELPIILLGHILVNGAEQNGHILNNGMSILNFKGSDIVYRALGHIHKRQKVGRYVYSGSINRINFGDEGDDKGFIHGILNHGKVKTKFIQLESREFKTINAIWGTGVKKQIGKLDLKNVIVKLNIEDKKGNAVIPILNIKKYLNTKGAIIDSVNVFREINHHVRDKKYKTDLSPFKMLKHYLKDESESVIIRGQKILKRIMI